MAEQRNKEIGIRKVLGASVSGITAMLSKDFVKLVLIAFVIASPIPLVGNEQMATDFAYQITIGWWMFAIAGFIAVLIALITISFRVVCKGSVGQPSEELEVRINNSQFQTTYTCSYFVYWQ